MNIQLTDRMNEILPRITDESFLAGEGIGNEIAFYIFDYPAKDELRVREHVGWMIQRLASHHKNLNVLHLDLIDVVIDYLKQRRLFDKTLMMQQVKGDAGVLKALKGPLAAERVTDFIAAQYHPRDYDLLLLSGVGSVWPMLRAHNLLSCLHPIMGEVPLVMFYPGSYDGTTLRLFDQISANNADAAGKPYYRAFPLVPGETKP